MDWGQIRTIPQQNKWANLTTYPQVNGWNTIKKFVSGVSSTLAPPIMKSLANIGAVGANDLGNVQMLLNKPEQAQKSFDKAIAARQYAGTMGNFDEGFKSGATTLIKGGLSAGQTALTAGGLPLVNASRLVTAGLLGGAMSKIGGGDFITGAGQAVGSLPQILGFVGATNPILAKYLPKNSQISDRILGAGGNVIQGIGMDLARGTPTTPLGIGIDLATGALGGTTQFDIPNVKSLNPDVFVSDKNILNEAKQQLRTGIELDPFSKLGKDLDNMYKNYGLASYPDWNKLTMTERVNVLDDRVSEMAKQWGNNVKMGIVDDSKTTGNKPITFDEIKKFDNLSNRSVYTGANEDIEVLNTRVKPENLDEYFEINREIEKQSNLITKNREKYYEMAKLSNGKDNDSWKLYDESWAKEHELARVKNLLDNYVGYGNDPKELKERFLREDLSPEFKKMVDRVLSLKITPERKEIRLINGRPSGYFDNTKEIGRKTLSFSDIEKIKPESNEAIVDEMISSGWKGSIINPDSSSLKTALAKIYGEDIPIGEEKTFFGNKALSDTLYNRQVERATNPKIISALKFAIEKEQETLKKLYPSGKITLYRGLGTKNVNEDKLFTSWTDDISVANKFGKKGTVIKKEIPIEDVVLSYNTQRTLGKMGENMPDFVKGLMGGNADQEFEYIVKNTPTKISPIKTGSKVNQPLSQLTLKEINQFKEVPHLGDFRSASRPADEILDSFQAEASKWTKGVDPEGKLNAYQLASNNWKLRRRLLKEQFGDWTGTTTVYRVGPATDDITSVFSDKNIAESYAKRMGVESINEFKAVIDDLVPSQSGSGELFVDKNSLIQSQPIKTGVKK
jgi:hypothetical protein